MARDRFWLTPFLAEYRFVRVDLATGLEKGELANITGGQVERNQDTAIFEQGSIDYTGALDMGTDLLRVYLEASDEWSGERRTEELGTFYVSTPKASNDGAVSTATADIYGRLLALEKDDFDGPYVVRAGTGYIEAARSIAEGCGLEVVADPSDLVLDTTWVFGISTTSSDEDRSDSKLAAVNRLLSAAGFLAAHTDPHGHLLMRRYTEPDERPLSFDYTEGEDCRVMPDVESEHDTFSVVNVVHVDYSSQDASIRGTAVDDDPDSPYSTISTGRRVTARYDLTGLPDSVTADANLLKGAATMSVGAGTAQDSSFRRSDGAQGGSIATSYVPDSQQTGVFFGIAISNPAGSTGFCQDKVGNLEKGKPVTMSVWVKGTKGAKGYIRNWWVPSLSDGSRVHDFTLTGEWQRLVATETPADSYSDISAGYVMLTSPGELTAVADKVEDGAVATAWPQDAIQRVADERAATLIADNRSVITRRKFNCVYDPVTVYDAGNLHLPTVGTDLDHACIRTQVIKFDTACPMTMEVRKFERSAE